MTLCLFDPPPWARSSLRCAGIVPLHEGYQALLDSQLPVLAEEVSQCIALLFPRAGDTARTAGTLDAKSVRFAGSTEPAPQRQQQADVGSAEVQSTVALLLGGIDAELLGLIDSMRASRSALCLPMLGATLAWRQQLDLRGPAARQLVALLRKCEERLSAVLAAFFSERTASIQK